MPDDPSALRDEVAALRAANARLRAVVEAKDTEIAALRAALEAGQARQAEVIRRLELRVAELDRRLGMDSSNSSSPPSKEPLAAKARQRAAQRASLRERSPMRRPGGQPGHRGPGWSPRVTRTGPRRLIRLPSAGRAGRGWPAPSRRAGDGGRCGISRRCGWRRCTGCCRSCAAAPAGRSPRLTRLVGGPGQWSTGRT